MELPRLWLVTPVYFDVPAFSRLRDEITALLAPLVGQKLSGVHFLLVDDSAGFDVQIESLRGSADLTVVDPAFNLGHQRALVHALRGAAPRIADRDFIVTLDADGEDRPEDLPRLLAPLLAAEDDLRKMTLAIRTFRRERWPFKILYFFFKIAFLSLTGVTVRSGNYAAYRGWLCRRMLQHPHFDLCYSSSLISLKVPFEGVPCPRGARYAGKSRMGYLGLLLHGIRMLMPFTERIAIRALVAFSVIFGLGVLLALGVVGVKLTTDLAIPGWATSTLLLVLILSFVALGNFVVLFVVFSQSRGIALQNFEEPVGRARVSSPSPD
jgi:hypothetical protein